jgi:hypothetical protein
VSREVRLLQSVVGKANGPSPGVTAGLAILFLNTIEIPCGRQVDLISLKEPWTKIMSFTYHSHYRVSPCEIHNASGLLTGF